MTKEAQEARAEQLTSLLTVDQRRHYASIALPPLDYLKSVYTDVDTPLDIAVAAARAAAPYEHRKLPTTIDVNTNDTSMFNMENLKKLNSDELRAFLTMTSKMGIDFAGSPVKDMGNVLEVKPSQTTLHISTLKAAANIAKDLTTAKIAKKKVKA